MKNPSLERRRLIGVSSSARRQPSVSQVMGPGPSPLSVGQSTMGLLQSLRRLGASELVKVSDLTSAAPAPWAMMFPTSPDSETALRCSQPTL